MIRETPTTDRALRDVVRRAIDDNQYKAEFTPWCNTFMCNKCYGEIVSKQDDKTYRALTEPPPRERKLDLGEPRPVEDVQLAARKIELD